MDGKRRRRILVLAGAAVVLVVVLMRSRGNTAGQGQQPIGAADTASAYDAGTDPSANFPSGDPFGWGAQTAATVTSRLGAKDRKQLAALRRQVRTENQLLVKLTNQLDRMRRRRGGGHRKTKATAGGGVRHSPPVLVHPIAVPVRQGVRPPSGTVAPLGQRHPLARPSHLGAAHVRHTVPRHPTRRRGG